MQIASPEPLQLAPPVPFLLWDTFEQALRTNIKRLAKDIAGTLGKSEAPLLDAILKNGKSAIRPYIFEEADSDDIEVDMRCDFMCQRPDAPLFLQPCRQPVVWTAATMPNKKVHRCAEHLYSKSEKIPGNLPILMPLEVATDSEGTVTPLFVSNEGTVYDKEYNPRGQYDKERRTLVLFVVAEA
jgi:hypothetical protein